MSPINDQPLTVANVPTFVSRSLIRSYTSPSEICPELALWQAFDRVFHLRRNRCVSDN
jgi:hypothetical protein